MHHLTPSITLLGTAGDSVLLPFSSSAATKRVGGSPSAEGSSCFTGPPFSSFSLNGNLGQQEDGANSERSPPAHLPQRARLPFLAPTYTSLGQPQPAPPRQELGQRGRMAQDGPAREPRKQRKKQEEAGGDTQHAATKKRFPTVSPPALRRRES